MSSVDKSSIISRANEIIYWAMGKRGIREKNQVVSFSFSRKKGGKS